MPITSLANQFWVRHAHDPAVHNGRVNGKRIAFGGRRFLIGDTVLDTKSSRGRRLLLFCGHCSYLGSGSLDQLFEVFDKCARQLG